MPQGSPLTSPDALWELLQDVAAYDLDALLREVARHDLDALLRELERDEL
jgi:hypothetical protein